MAVNVLSIGSTTIYVDGKPVYDTMSALVYNPDNGFLGETNLIECVAKTIVDERDKNSKPITFGAPRED